LGDFGRYLRNPAGRNERTLAEVYEGAVDALRTRRVPFLVHGALAMSAYGFDRMTGDVDFLVFVGESSVRGVFDAMAAIGASPAPPGPRDADTQLARMRRRIRGASRVRFEAGGGWFVDFFFDADFRRVASRALRKRLGARVVRVIAPRDLAARKAAHGTRKDLIDLDWMRENVLPRRRT